MADSRFGQVYAKYPGITHAEAALHLDEFPVVPFSAVPEKKEPRIVVYKIIEAKNGSYIISRVSDNIEYDDICAHIDETGMLPKGYGGFVNGFRHCVKRS